MMKSFSVDIDEIEDMESIIDEACTLRKWYCTFTD